MMKAGRYYVGDLCYVMHNEWPEVCDAILEPDGMNQGEFKLKDGRRFAIMSTKWGDGTYNGCWVDSGTIGCIKMEDIRDDTYSLDQITKMARIEDFDRDFTPYNEDGVLNFCGLIIDTKNDEYYLYYGEGEDE